MIKKKILIACILGVVSLSLVGCKDDNVVTNEKKDSIEDLSLEEKKKLVEDLQEEIKNEEEQLLYKDIDTTEISKEEWITFRDKYNELLSINSTYGNKLNCLKNAVKDPNEVQEARDYANQVIEEVEACKKPKKFEKYIEMTKNYVLDYIDLTSADFDEKDRDKLIRKTNEVFEKNYGDEGDYIIKIMDEYDKQYGCY